MTEQQTVTCRSVCERLVSHFVANGLLGGCSDIVGDARLALGQPDSDADDLRADVRSLTQQLDAANKRADEAEAKLRELESVTGKTIAQHGDILERRIDNVEFLAGWLLDRLVERGAS